MKYSLKPVRCKTPVDSNGEYHKGNAVEPAIWGLVGTIVGALASIGTSWLSTRSTLLLQKLKADDERIERANAFQRQTLLDLQEAIHDALRLVHRANIEDVKAHRNTNAWGVNSLSDEVNEGIRIAQRKVFILVERVSDDSVRIVVKNLMATTTQSLLALNEQAAQSSLHKAAKDAMVVLEKIGSSLRKHYEPNVGQ